MNRFDVKQQLRNLAFFLLLQLPFLYKFILFDRAFGFFYIGFVLLLPLSLSIGLTMAIGFFAGLLVDVFSNTPGVHAAACVLISYSRVAWFKFSIDDDIDQNIDVSWSTLGVWGALKYFSPLILLHHFTLFLTENGGWYPGLLSKVIYSTLYTSLLCFAIAFLIAPRKRRQ